MKMLKNGIVSALLVAGLLGFGAAANASTTYGFQWVPDSGGAPENSLLADQLSLVVDTHGADDGWDLTVNNLGPIGSNVAEIYFYSASSNFFSSFAYESKSAGVNIGTGTPNPADLPGINSLPGSWLLSFALDTDPNKGSCPLGGGQVCGINPTEWVTFHATTGFDLLAALNSGLVRAGLHIRSISPTGESDSYITVGNPVPLPAAAWLFGSALLGFIGFSVRRRV